MEWRMERQAPFLKSVLQEANQHNRQELLRMANADYINAISESCTYATILISL